MQSPDRDALKMAGCAALILAQLIAAKATRDALFLSVVGAEYLPVVMFATACLALAAALGASRAIARFSPQLITPFLLVLNAALFMLELALLPSRSIEIAVATYLHTGALGAVVVSAFFSLVNERFDPHTARRLVSRIVTGAAIGGAGGGLLVVGLSRVISLRAMLAVIAAICVLAAVVLVASGATRAISSDRRPAQGGVRLLLETRYLRHVALLIAMLAAADVLIDYVFKASVSAELESPATLVAFFAAFQTVLGIGTLVLQAGFARRSLRILGITKTMAFLPLVIALGAAAALAFPIAASVTMLRGATAAIASSLFRSAYELLYTPLSLPKKRSAKAIVDVAADKLGGAAGSAFAMVVALMLASSVAWAISMAVALILAAIALALTRVLHRGYVHALTASLKSGAIRLEAEDVLDATTQETLNDTLALDRNLLKTELARVDPPAEAADPFVRDIVELRAANPRRVRAALSRLGVLPPELVGHVIPLLARDDVFDVAREALRIAAPRASGQLIDALLDPERDERIRRRLPRVLQTSSAPNVLAALIAGLEDPSFEVRHRCAAALLHRRTNGGGFQIDREQLFAIARAEVTRPDGPLVDRPDETPAFELDGTADPRSRKLAQMFTLLALVFDAESVHLAFRALNARDPRLRGTGREYLEVTLPPDLSKALAPYWG